nr:MAG TPA: hypothetical protein [Caudoviricetes sp.]
MLTDKERKWLENRKIRCSRCVHYEVSGVGGICFWCADREKFETSAYTLASDYRDAAEFEARAKMIALHLDIEDVPCAHGMTMFCPAKHFKGKGCGDWCRMRMAHLQAEKEMDNE